MLYLIIALLSFNRSTVMGCGSRPTSTIASVVSLPIAYEAPDGTLFGSIKEYLRANEQRLDNILNNSVKFEAMLFGIIIILGATDILIRSKPLMYIMLGILGFNFFVCAFCFILKRIIKSEPVARLINDDYFEVQYID